MKILKQSRLSCIFLDSLFRHIAEGYLVIWKKEGGEQKFCLVKQFKHSCCKHHSIKQQRSKLQCISYSYCQLLMKTFVMLEVCVVEDNIDKVIIIIIDHRH